MNRTDFQELADMRVAEAECLFRNGMFNGAYYLAGYAVEAGLKACIAKLTKPHDFPPRNAQRDCYTHDLAVLLKTAGLDLEFGIDRKANSRLDLNWSFVKAWGEESRYEPRGSKSKVVTSNFIQGIIDVPNGVLTWIKTKW